ncbi:signal peptidase II [Sphingomonas oleivorans]|uniref:Lipoprotein signal peptidase n=1 Tax=Sphingomonas oleivorans TaxID=1735121 RepID=A0A2T5FZZ8_9SPHN|nr:signal peptidase II [Sphingomonas oleivorans]PTQ12282.1 signal peptidase II [Sphingomonas oleivorans]
MAEAATRTHRVAGLAAAALVFVADQLSKWIVTHPLDLKARGMIELLPIFDLRWVENYGVSMGFLTADGALGRWLLVALTGVIATIVAVWMWRERRRPDAMALGLVLGGAIGNILDRVRFGHVVDFADLHFGEWHPFLVFNVADAAISIGVLLLVLRALFVREGRAPSEDVHA